MQQELAEVTIATCRMVHSCEFLFFLTISQKQSSAADAAEDAAEDAASAAADAANAAASLPVFPDSADRMIAMLSRRPEKFRISCEMTTTRLHLW